MLEAETSTCAEYQLPGILNPDEILGSAINTITFFQFIKHI